MNIPDIIMLPPNRVWRTYHGGKILDKLEGKPDPQDSHFPEDWIASTTIAKNEGREEFKDEGLAKVEIDGGIETLKNLIRKFPDEIVGREHYKKYGANLQFLIKFLDSAIRLHIQAHPTIPFAKKYLSSNSGKTEAYVILGIREDVKEHYIYLGFQKPIPKEKFKTAVLEQDINTILSCFEKIPVKPGDVFIVPGGLPHAIGEGVFMIEIMEPTDFVVRLENERGGYLLPEKARYMGHDIDFAMDMIDFTPFSIEQVKEKYFCKPKLLNKEEGGEEFVLIDKEQTSCFSVHQLNVTKRFTKNLNGFCVGVVTNGAGTLITAKHKLNIKTGDKFLVPFQTNKVEFTTDNEIKIVLAFPPQ